MAERRVRSLTGIVAPGQWDDLINVASVKEALGPDPNAPVTLILHSPGGDAREGLAIYGAIRRHQGDVRIEIDGEAASAASLIAFAGDSLYMAAGAQIMMHEPSLVFIFMVADKRVLLRMANRLESTIKSYAATYAAATVLTEAAARTMMEEETWLVAKDAARLGLAKVHDPGRARPAPVPEPSEDDDFGDFGLAAWEQVAAWNREDLTLSGKKGKGTVHMGDQVPTAGDQTQPVRPAIPDPYSELELADEAKTVVIAVPKSDWEKLQTTLDSRKQQIEGLEGQIASMQASDLDARIQTALDKAVADTRITPAEVDTWRERLGKNFDIMLPALEDRTKQEAYHLRKPVGDGSGQTAMLTSVMRDRLRESGMGEDAMVEYERALAAGELT